jgi:hypothetical protein
VQVAALASSWSLWYVTSCAAVRSALVVQRLACSLWHCLLLLLLLLLL